MKTLRPAKGKENLPLQQNSTGLAVNGYPIVGNQFLPDEIEGKSVIFFDGARFFVCQAAADLAVEGNTEAISKRVVLTIPEMSSFAAISRIKNIQELPAEPEK